MVRREGLDWCAVPMPLLLKTAELLSPAQQLNSHEGAEARVCPNNSLSHLSSYAQLRAELVRIDAVENRQHNVGIK